MTRRAAIAIVAAVLLGLPAQASAGAWIRQSAPGSSGLSSVSCVDASTCTAVGGGTSPVIVGTTNGGSSWHSETAPGGVGGLAMVSCVAATTECWAVGGRKVIHTSNNGLLWTTQDDVGAVGTGGGLTAIDCSSFSTCVAIGSDMTSSPAVGFSIKYTGAWGGRVTMPGTGFIPSGLSCFTTSSCASVGSESAPAPQSEKGAADKTSSGGSGWSTGTVPNEAFLFGVSCVSAGIGHCWASGDDPAFHAVIVASTNGGASWSAQTVPAGINGLYLLSCVDANNCWAPGFFGSGQPAIVATSDGGAHWGTQGLPSIAGGGQLVSVDCLNASVCFAVGTAGLSPNPPSPLILATTTGGFTNPSISSGGSASASLQGSKVVVNTGETAKCPPGGATCSATVTGKALSTGTASARAAAAKKLKSVVVGKATLKVKSGKRAKIKFALNKTGKKLLKKLGHLKITVTTSVHAGKRKPVVLVKTIKVKQPKKKH